MRKKRKSGSVPSPSVTRASQPPDQEVSSARDELAPYFALRRMYPVLTQEEFNSALKVYRTAKTKAAREHARDKLTFSNIGLIITIAYRSRHHGVRLSLLVNEALAVMATIVLDKFDETRGLKISTYASWWIRSAIHNSIRMHKTGMAVSIPEYQMINLGLITRARKEFKRANGRVPDQEELLKTINGFDAKVAKAITMEKLKNTLQYASIHVDSFDAPLHPDAEFTLGDILPAPVQDGHSIEERLSEPGGIGERVQEALAELATVKPRHHLIVRCRYGLDGQYPETLKTAGSRLKISRERARQIQNEALRFMRKITGISEERLDAVLLALGEMAVFEPEVESLPNGMSLNGDEMEEVFAIFSEHAVDWRGRGTYRVLAPFQTLCARVPVPSDVIRRTLHSFNTYKWIEAVEDQDAVILLRTDQVPALKKPGSEKKTAKKKRSTKTGKKRPVKRLTFATQKSNIRLRQRRRKNDQPT